MAVILGSVIILIVLVCLARLASVYAEAVELMRVAAEETGQEFTVEGEKVRLRKKVTYK